MITVFESRTPILSVSQLNYQVKKLLEECLDIVDIEGEISNFTCAASGHWYFSLKDDKAQVSCAMFSKANSRVTKMPTNGDKVIVRASVTIYAARGNYQLLVRSLQLAGLGQWQVAFAELQRKLAAEGLFAQDRKQILPRFPKRLGVISSLDAAALQDILRTVNRRFPALPVSIYPSSVQGERAESDLVSALQLAQEDNRCDLLIIARGGGSIEDIWTFNLETVARAIVACEIPIISAIGHETDFTIADFVADLRASTPTAAAEQATPDKREVLAMLRETAGRITNAMEYTINNAEQGLDRLKSMLRHPSQQVEMHQQHLDQLTQTMNLLLDKSLDRGNNSLTLLHKQLEQLDYRKPLLRGYSLAQDSSGRIIANSVAAREARHFSLQFHDDHVGVKTIAPASKDEPSLHPSDD